MARDITKFTGVPGNVNNSPTRLPGSGSINVDLRQSNYDFNYLVFPNDLGMDNQGHYMIININVPTTIFGGGAAGRYTDRITPLGDTEISNVDRLRRGLAGTNTTQPTLRLPAALETALRAIPGFGAIFTAAEFLARQTQGNSAFFTLPRQTRRIAQSIALHMPTPLVFNTQNMYEEISLTALAGKLGVGAVSSALGLTRSATQSIQQRIISAQGIRSILNGLGQSIGTAAAITQNPINPAVEILFTNTPVRQFTFELLMAPRNEKESETIKNIIQTLRFHAAPEINPVTLGLTWIPPAEFDISFYNKGTENMNILRINTCVLERIEVDYAPTTGVYSTFRNGHPVTVRLSMGFRELEPIHKQRVLQGF